MDRTYLSISVWRAFVVVALLPYLVLLLHPDLFRTPWDWNWRHNTFVTDPASAAQRAGSLLVLTALVYLSRNAILRVRETYADATAASYDGPGGGLAAVLGRLPEPPWWRRWGTHPQPRQRLAAVHDPGLVLATRWWEPAGVGLAAGLISVNVGFLTAINFLADPRLIWALVGFVTGPVMAGLLAVTIWRATARHPGRPAPVQIWLGYPGALVAGYAAGTVLTLRGAGAGGPAAWLIAMVVLAAGATALTMWLASAGRDILALPRRPAWAMPAVVGVAAFAGAVWFAVWLPASLIEDGFASGWGPPPVAGAEIGLYAATAAVAGAEFGPIRWLVFNPLTLFGLTLMWLVPVLAAARSRSRAGGEPLPLRRPFAAGLAGAVCVAAITVALLFAAEAALPAEVRSSADREGVTFATVYQNATLVVAAIVVAAVMTVVGSRRGPGRAALAILAGCLTTVLSTAVLAYLTDPIACRLDLFEAHAATPNCLVAVRPAALSEMAHWTLLQAILIAAPALLAVAVVTTLRRRRPTASAPAAEEAGPPAPRLTARRATVAAGLTLGLLAAINLWLSALTLPEAYQIWLERLLG